MPYTSLSASHPGPRGRPPLLRASGLLPVVLLAGMQLGHQGTQGGLKRLLIEEVRRAQILDLVHDRLAALGNAQRRGVRGGCCSSSP
jgi:hypothetical protein